MKRQRNGKPKHNSTWEAQLTPQELNVFRGLLGAALTKELPFEILKFITELGGGYESICRNCGYEIFNSEYNADYHEPKTGISYSEECLLCEECYNDMHKKVSCSPYSLPETYSCKRWVQCVKCGVSWFNPGYNSADDHE